MNPSIVAEANLSKANCTSDEKRVTGNHIVEMKITTSVEEEAARVDIHVKKWNREVKQMQRRKTTSDLGAARIISETNKTRTRRVSEIYEIITPEKSGLEGKARWLEYDSSKGDIDSATLNSWFNFDTSDIDLELRDLRRDIRREERREGRREEVASDVEGERLLESSESEMQDQLMELPFGDE